MKLKPFNKKTKKFLEPIEIENFLSYLFLQPNPNATAYLEIKRDYDDIIWLKSSGWFDKNKKEIFEEDILELTNECGDLISIICKFGSVKRKIYTSEDVYPEVEINGFYFLINTQNGKKTFPIVKNYLGKHDCEIMQITGNTLKEKENVFKF